MFSPQFSRLTLAAVSVVLVTLGGTLLYYSEGVTRSISITEQFITPASTTTIQTPQPSPSPPSELTILFGGDLMFDRYIRTLAERRGAVTLSDTTATSSSTAPPADYDFFFDGIRPLLTSYNLVVANLEGPITTRDSISQGSEVGSPRNFFFTFSPDITPALERANITHVNLGNNHLDDFGAEGAAETLRWLEQSDIAYFGQINDDIPNLDTTITHKEHAITFINYNQFGGGSLEQAVASVAAAQTVSDFQIVYTHWDNEYEVEPAPITRQRAQQLVAAGADFIIGSHPHVIQINERIDGVPVYYSLGNFVFDQYFEAAVRTGLLVGVTLREGEIVGIEEYRIDIGRDGELELLE
jgi:poly-gamma-glutamate synthesis protein (capsule biosynthesis protein)